MNMAVTTKRSEYITLFVGNLADETTEDDVRSLFGQFASVSEIRLIPGYANRTHDGCCYLKMRGRPAQAAIDGLNGRAFRGAILRVHEAQAQSEDPATAPATQRPRSLDERSVSATRLRYRVASVEKAEMPLSKDGDDWYRYVLSSGNSQITGFHRGSLADVKEYAANCVEEFNLRSIRGKAARPMAPARKK